MENCEFTEENRAKEQMQMFPVSDTTAYQPKALFDLEKRDFIFVVCAVAASMCTAALGLFGGFALGYLIATLVMMTLFCVFLGKKGKLHVFPVACGVLVLLNSAVFICTTNGSVRFFCVIVSLLLAFMCFDGLVNGSPRGNRKILEVFCRAIATIGNVNISVKTLFLNRNGNKKAIGKVLIGLVCAVPVLLVVVPLLIASDDAFRGMMENVLKNTWDTTFKLIVGLMISPFVISYGISLKKGRVAEFQEKKYKGVENVYLISFLSSIALCYVLYLFSQLAYFFSAFRGFLPEGEMTYAQYARKGFFEMCVIAVINLVLVLTALLIARKKNGKVCGAVKALTTFIGVFTIVIISTAISKMVLYIDVYGMTVLRVTTSAFMLFLSIVFICVILRIYISSINIPKVALLAAGCVVLVLGTVNVNGLCAKYNYESYQSGKLDSIDIDALYGLGEEGIPYIVMLASDGNTAAVRNEAKHYLAKACVNDYFENFQEMEGLDLSELRESDQMWGFERFSIPKMMAYRSLYAFLEENPRFVKRYKDYLIT